MVYIRKRYANLILALIIPFDIDFTLDSGRILLSFPRNYFAYTKLAPDKNMGLITAYAFF
jgi:hypothetical protein